MPRNMAFSMTTPQMRNRTKTVTRRAGWLFLEADDIVNSCVKCQGLPKGSKVERICQILIIEARREPLDYIEREGMAGTAAEGFPDLEPWEFVLMYCEAAGDGPKQTVTRIEFKFVD